MLKFSTVIIVHVSKKFVSYFFSIVSWLCSHILNFLRNLFFSKKVPVVHVRTLFFAVSFLLIC